MQTLLAAVTILILASVAIPGSFVKTDFFGGDADRDFVCCSGPWRPLMSDNAGVGGRGDHL